MGCGQGGPLDEERAGNSEQPIFNGQVDVTHDAVVAVKGEQSVCTGTIVAKNVAAKRAYVLTAAHCVDDPPQLIVRGTNWLNGTQYPVVDYLAHSSYNGQVYDFAMVTFSWSQAEPPVIPAMTAPDNLGAGSEVRFVGYGVTESNANNTVRYYFDGEIGQVQALTFAYNQSNSGQFANDGGPCFGDSGGPALFNIPGTGWVVAGVTSYGDQACTKYGVSGRTSAVSSWITNYINNGGGGNPGQTCDQCFQESTSPGGACIGVVNTCLNSAQCSALVECLNDCQTDACAQGCAADYPGGVDPYLAIFACVCDTGCQSECEGEQFCEGGSAPQDCGFTAQDPQCLSCFEGACCAQGAACAQNAACTDCLTGEDPNPSCIEENVLAAQFYQCLVQKCGDECGLGGGGSGAGGNGSGAGGNTSGSGAGSGEGGAGVGGGGVGGNGSGNDDKGGNDNNDDDGGDGNVKVVSCTACSTTGDAPANGNLAMVLGAAVAGLFASRRRRR